ncbi:type II toxin-antitoxin system RelE/ParE family toxin [Indioceanicola profundi]|uniref:type II toxin-antitoxin system RelE/ParE family toxin n=1 Tax=Indioceanicola profundi TaxID=2220096 RepID=UPI0013C4872D|nr:type II toxin-antitoxin system RelE/ParE family toxin [Indioceanicola profundi]
MRVVFSAEAKADIASAKAWYDDQGEGLGSELLEDLRSLAQRLSMHPLAFPMAEKGARRASLRRFPYVLYFYVSERSVRVVACFHTSRDPAHRQQRF